ncbi:MAG: PqqD family peptide modification chaperone [Anaerolineaceae bacterium]|nr:PqqD family peptide modification chaperone [Anaerolineaceae bacterium]
MKSIWHQIPILDQTGGLWSQITISNKPLSSHAFNIWSSLANQAGGMWKELANETLIIRASSKKNADIWQEINDETLIIRPKSDLWEIIQQIRISRDALGFWEEIGQQTLMISRPTETVWSQSSKPDFSKLKPMRRLGWALKKLQTAEDVEYYILKNTRQGTYLKLNESQVFLWNHMDGEHTIQDIAIAYFIQYKSMAIKRLFIFLGQLESKGFLADNRVNIYNAADKSMGKFNLASLGRKIWQRITHTTITINGIDRFVTSVYKAGGALLFSRLAQILILVTTISGLIIFGIHVQRGEYSVIKGAAQAPALGLLGLFLAQMLAIFLHELSHALTCKHYGREVRKAGIMIYLGMPAFFVDTTDIWMEPRKPRILVSWAGPYSGFFLAALASLMTLIAGQSIVSGLFFQFAFACILISLTNLNPLLRLDGYYILMDWLEIPMLRVKAINFVRNDLCHKIKKRDGFSRVERIFSIMGILSLIWTGLMMISLAKLFGGALSTVFQNFMGPQIGLILYYLLTAGIAIFLLWPLIGGFFQRKHKKPVMIDNKV